ncbi:MAG: hypothetical protein BroJett030_02760 [Alphaproteobacteria bacterium]|nr:MAG: hypothetical protein BroJett030_02760 [Alphaproteobacteria bacterium]
MQARSSTPPPAPPSTYRLWLAVAAVGGLGALPPHDDRAGLTVAQAGPVAAATAAPDPAPARDTDAR